MVREGEVGARTCRPGGMRMRIFDYGPVNAIADPNKLGGWDLYVWHEENALVPEEFMFAWEATDEAVGGRRRRRGFIQGEDKSRLELHDEEAYVAEPENRRWRLRQEAGLTPEDEPLEEMARRVRRAARLAWSSAHGRRIAKRLAGSELVERVDGYVAREPLVGDPTVWWKWGIRPPGPESNGADYRVKGGGGRLGGKLGGRLGGWAGGRHGALFGSWWEDAITQEVVLRALVRCAAGEAGFYRGEAPPGDRMVAFLADVFGCMTVRLVGEEMPLGEGGYDDERVQNHISTWKLLGQLIGEGAAMGLDPKAGSGFSIEGVGWAAAAEGMHGRLLGLRV